MWKLSARIVRREVSSDNSVLLGYPMPSPYPSKFNSAIKIQKTPQTVPVRKRKLLCAWVCVHKIWGNGAIKASGSSGSALHLFLLYRRILFQPMSVKHGLIFDTNSTSSIRFIRLIQVQYCIKNTWMCCNLSLYEIYSEKSTRLPLMTSFTRLLYTISFETVSSLVILSQ